jgi:[acyl-carrier-protein] S-malonyltransferase
MGIGVLFPGQGSQYPGMADPWLEHTEGRRQIEQASEALGWDVAEAGRDPEKLKRTEIVQPAVVACDLAAFAVLRSEGVPCHAVAGHSLGEYAALIAAGAVDFTSGLSTLATRAEAMAKASDDNPGGMTALIGLSSEDAAEICEVAGRGDVITVANENAPRQIVLSGSVSAIERAEVLARGRGGRAVRLQVAGAFHSPLMQSAVQPVREAISRIEFRRPSFPVLPNASGKPTTQPVVLRDLLARHLISPVFWSRSVEAMANDLGIDWFLEAGPGDVLAKLVRRIAPATSVRLVGSPADAEAVAKELREREGARTEEAR